MLNGALLLAYALTSCSVSTFVLKIKALVVSLAYFIYDSIACELIEHDLANLLHHLATILGLCVGVFQRFVSSHPAARSAQADFCPVKTPIS